MINRLINRLHDVIASVYIYNEFTGYKELEKLIIALETNYSEEKEFIEAVKKHYDDEQKHYLMFRNYFKSKNIFPFKIDKAYGYIDLFINHVFKKPIDELNHQEIIQNKDSFFKLCRLIMLTEFRGMKQVNLLLKGPLLNNSSNLKKIFKVIERDEPSHCYPYQYWLKKHGTHLPQLQEKLTDLWIHYSLTFIKIPFLFFNCKLKRMNTFYG